MRDEATFVLRFSLGADIPERLLESDDFDETAWRREWESAVKPGLLREVFRYLRSVPGWSCHVRNRGVSADDEVEIVVERDLD